MAVAMHQPPPPDRVRTPKLPPELSDLVMQLLEKDAGRRPASAGRRRAPARAGTRFRCRRHTGAARCRGADRGQIRGRARPADRRRRHAGVPIAVRLFLRWHDVHIATNKGELVINCDDPNIEVTVTGKTANVYDKAKDRRFVLTAGDYDVKVEVRDKGEVARLRHREVHDRANGMVTFDATLKLAQAAPPKVPEEKAKTPVPPPEEKETPKTPAVTKIPPLDPVWLEKVVAMSVDEQLAAVKAELIKRNPKFDGKIDHKLDKNGAVSDVKFSADHVTDVSPVRAFPELRWFTCVGSGPGKGALADLLPLRGTKLAVLSIGDTQVADLTPVQGMPLVQYWFSGTQVQDLSALPTSS